jgi:hypothetical protein
MLEGDRTMDTTMTKSEKTPNKKNAVTSRIFFLDTAGGRVLSANPDGSSRKAESFRTA